MSLTDPLLLGHHIPGHPRLHDSDAIAHSALGGHLALGPDLFPCLDDQGIQKVRLM